jgi:hypothetical protein
LKKEACVIKAPAVTINGVEKLENSPDMVKLSPKAQSMSCLIKFVILGCSMHGMLFKVSKIEIVPKIKSACKKAAVFAFWQVTGQENMVAVSRTPIKLAFPTMQTTLLSGDLDPSTAKTTFFWTPDHN